MLSQKNYEALLFIRDGAPILSSAFTTLVGFERSCELERQRFITELLGPSPSGKSTIYYYRITPKGEDALAEYENSANDKARKKAHEEENRSQALQDKRKDRQHDYLIAIFSFVLGIFSAIISQHFGEIIAFIGQLFQ